MRILIFILALMSAFFVSAQDERSKVPATSEVKPTWLCTVNSIGFSQRVPADDFSLCESTVQSAFDEGNIPAPTRTNASPVTANRSCHRIFGFIESGAKSYK